MIAFGTGLISGLVFINGLAAGIMWERYGRFRWELLAVTAACVAVLITVQVSL